MKKMVITLQYFNGNSTRIELDIMEGNESKHTKEIVGLISEGRWIKAKKNTYVSTKNVQHFTYSII